MKQIQKTIDGNEAAAYIAHKTNELCVIYPITPSSPMGELADIWSAGNMQNIWGTIPHVIEMQSEAGASGAVHGALQTGSLTTTFTASQGLLLMIPNMYKIAGELTPTVFHIAARSLSAQALSIFGDHSDVMAARSTGFAMLCSSSVQEAHDMALIAQTSTLESRIPFMHFFDGFRTSHEINKINLIPDEQIKEMINDEWIFEHRKRALTPENPVVRGTAQNPDVYFQGRETVNPFYQATPSIVEKAMEKFKALTGREYHLANYFGDPNAERLIILMGSGTETVRETVNYLNQKKEKVGVLQIHLFRPFPAEYILNLIPESVNTIAVLDRTKEPGAIGEPLYQDISTAYHELSSSKQPKIIGGRYGLSSKEFNPAMVKGIFDELKKSTPKNHFTIGIDDDLSHTSLNYDPEFNTEPDDVVRAVFYGLGSDGTVGANKNSIKIIGDNTDLHIQAYFVYDSKKAGARTVSHLRFGPNPIRSTYLIQSANFLGCHQFNFMQAIDVLKTINTGGTFLLNSPYDAKTVWNYLPRIAQEHIINKKINFYVIDAYKVAKETEVGVHINTIMQTCFFHITQILPAEVAIQKIKDAIQKTYGKKGEEIVKKNFNAVDQAIAHLEKVVVPQNVTSNIELSSAIDESAPDFVKDFTLKLMQAKGDEVPVSLMPNDGTFPSGTTKWEKRNTSQRVPCWDPETCIQCGMCSMVCPHSVIRVKHYDEKELQNAPESFQSAPLKGSKESNQRYSLQVYVEDCTGCGLCMENCPAKNKQHPDRKAINMTEKASDLTNDRNNIQFFETLPQNDRETLNTSMVKDVQYIDPLFEFSGACAGCGETPYLKTLSQLFGDRMLIANATGCSSIYGGNLPTTPWTKNAENKGPSWSNSLFEDNAEFGFGFRLSENKHYEQARELLEILSPEINNKEFITKIIEANDSIDQQRERIEQLNQTLKSIKNARAKHLLSLSNYLIRHSVWIIGGDGWAYDIGYGGLDHVLASGQNVNVLVLDTMVYSNTGGQASKATPRGAIAKFAAHGKPTAKKDLGFLALTYGNIYVAQIALDANPRQTLIAFKEAEQYNGPSLIIAYSQCIAHGTNLQLGTRQQKLAIESGFWPLYRYNPDRIKENLTPLQLDSKEPSIPFKEYAQHETRFKMLAKVNPEHVDQLMQEAQEDVNRRWKMLEKFAKE